MLCFCNDTERLGRGGRGRLSFVDPTVKSTILTAGPGKQKKKQRKQKSLHYKEKVSLDKTAQSRNQNQNNSVRFSSIPMG